MISFDLGPPTRRGMHQSAGAARHQAKATQNGGKEQDQRPLAQENSINRLNMVAVRLTRSEAIGGLMCP